MNVNEERERRLNKTGRWFNDSAKASSKDVYLTYLLPLVLIISLCATVYVAVTS